MLIGIKFLFFAIILIILGIQIIIEINNEELENTKINKSLSIVLIIIGVFFIGISLINFYFTYDNIKYKKSINNGERDSLV